MKAPSAIEHHDSVIGNSIVIKGEIIASVPLYVNGYVEGSISALEQCVTIGKQGRAMADISAGEVVIMGDVRGNLGGCSRVEIRGDGSFTGDLTTDRICIQDGAVVKGAIESHKPAENGKGETNPALEPLEDTFTPESTDPSKAWENLAVSEPV